MTNTLGPDYILRPQPVPPGFERFLERLGLQAPPAGKMIPMTDVDRALKGQSVGERMRAKAALRTAGLIL